MKMRRCEDEKMFYRPPLLEEPCAQTLSGEKNKFNSSNAEKIQWIHLSTDVKFSHLVRKLAQFTVLLTFPHTRRPQLHLQKSYQFQAQKTNFEARRGLGEATPRTQNVLAQGQSEAHGDSKLYNTIVEVPARLNLK